MGGTSRRLPLLRVILSCRIITAQVTNPISESIIAMASTSEPEFIPQMKAKLNRVPRHRNYVDPKMASRVGEKLGVRLKEIGVTNVEIDLKDELFRPIHQQKMVSPIFRTVKEAGIFVSGADELILEMCID